MRDRVQLTTTLGSDLARSLFVGLSEGERGDASITMSLTVCLNSDALLDASSASTYRFDMTPPVLNLGYSVTPVALVAAIRIGDPAPRSYRRLPAMFGPEPTLR